MIVKIIPRRKETWIELVPDVGDPVRFPLGEKPAGIGLGSALSDAEWSRLSELADYHKLYDTALRLLSRREHFTQELRLKLAKRERNRELVSRVIGECRERNYLDEERAARQLVAQLLSRGGIGRMRLKAELFKRGCDRALAEKMIEHHTGELDEAVEARRLLGTKRRTFASKLAALQRKQKDVNADEYRARRGLKQKLGTAIINFLRARGFTDADSRQAARELAQDLVEGD